MARKREERWVEISVEADRNAVDDLVNLLGRHCRAAPSSRTTSGAPTANGAGESPSRAFCPYRTWTPSKS